MMRRLKNVTHRECQPPWSPLPPSISRTDRDAPADFFLLGWVSFPLYKWSLLAKDIPLDPGTGLFCTVKWNLGYGLALPSLLDRKDWDKPMEDCCWACTRDRLIWPYRQASLGGITSLRLWRKGNCEAQTSWCCLETELNTCAKVWAEFPSHLDTALSQNIMNLEKQFMHFGHRYNTSLRIG